MARDVLIRLNRLSTTGKVPANAAVRFEPTVLRADADGYILDDYFDAVMVDGEATVADLPETDLNWAYKVQVRGHGRGAGLKQVYATWYVHLPTGEGTVNFEDLPRIDPKTLTPVNDPDPAWVAAVTAVFNDSVSTAVEPAMVTAVDDETSEFRARLNAASAEVVATKALSEAVTNAGGSNGPNLILGSVANRRDSGIASDVAVSVILNPGAGAGQNNIIGGNGATTVGTATPNTTTPGTNASVSVVGGYDNVAGSLSSKIISDHSYTEVGGAGHNAIYGGANNVARSTAGFAGIFAGYQSEVGGLYALACGYRNKASAQSSFVVGNDNTVTGTGSTASGSLNTVSGAYSAVAGNRNEVGGAYGAAWGMYAKTRDAYQQSFAPGRFAESGDSQTSVFVIAKKTTTDAITPLGIGGGNIGPIIPPNTSFLYTAHLVARHEGGTDTAAWELKGVLRRGATGAPVVVGTPTVTSLGADTGASTWAIYGVTGGSTGGLNVNVNGDATRTLRWVLRLTTVEVGAGAPA